MMKTKYDLMNKEEKKIIKEKFKNEKKALYKKFRTMNILIILAFIFSIVNFGYDFFIKKNTLSYVLDIVTVLFCIFAFIKVYKTRKDILNDIALKKQ